jgi:hypothetical protein
MYAQLPQMSGAVWLSSTIMVFYFWIYFIPKTHIFAYRYFNFIFLYINSAFFVFSLIFILYTYDVANRNGYVRCVSKWDSPHDIARPFARSPDLCEEALEKF